MSKLSSVAAAVGLIFLLLATVSFVAPPGTTPVWITSPVSDSMVPTITQDEAVVVTSKTPEVGDVILFQTESANRDVLHRIVNVTDDGSFITKGDANEITDQAEGMEPVAPRDVQGVVVTVNDDTYISIPVIGALLTNPAVIFSLWAVIMAIGFLPSITATVSSNRGRIQEMRFTSSVSRRTIIVLALVVMVVIPIAVMHTSKTENVVIVSSQGIEPGESGKTTVAVGESINRTISFSGGGLIAMTQTGHVTSGELERIAVKSGPLESSTDIVLRNPPRDEPGGQRATLKVYTYPATLPNSVLVQLADIHPLVAAIASSGVISGVIIVSTLLFVDSGGKSRQSRSKIRENRRSRHR